MLRWILDEKMAGEKVAGSGLRQSSPDGGDSRKFRGGKGKNRE